MKKKYEEINMTKLEINRNSLAAAAAAVTPVVISQKIEKVREKKAYVKPVALQYENNNFLLAAGGGGGYRIDNKIL